MTKNNSTAGFLEKCVLDGYPLLEPSTVCVIKAALKHDLKVDILDEARSFIKVYNDEKEEYIYQATKTSKDVSTFPFVTDNKVIVKEILRENNLNTPDGIILEKGISKRDIDYCTRPFIGRSVVVKPNTTNKGIGITVFEKPADQEGLVNAIKNAFRYDTKVIVEIFASRPKWYLDLIDQEYNRIYKCTLRSEIGKKKKDFNKFLMCLFDNEREEGKHLELNEAEQIVDEMLKVGLKKYGTDLELFKKVFVKKSREDFILISRVFCQKNPKKINLYQACDEQVGSANRELLKALVYAICDSSHYFGHNLKKAIVGIGTNTKTLNRILALRSEIDVDVIRERYKGETGRELIDDIKGDVSGDYCKFLCMLVNRNPSNTE